MSFSLGSETSGITEPKKTNPSLNLSVNFSLRYLNLMISLRARVGQSTLLLLMTLFALYSNTAVFSFFYHFLHPVQHKHLVALKEQRFNRNYFLGGRKENDYSCTAKFLITCSFQGADGVWGSSLGTKYTAMQEVICYPSHASHSALGAPGFLAARCFHDKGTGVP